MQLRLFVVRSQEVCLINDTVATNVTGKASSSCKQHAVWVSYVVSVLNEKTHAGGVLISF